MNNTDIQCAKSGIKFLDSIKPNWRDHVNADELVMHQSDKCIAGQVFRMEARGSDEVDGYGHLILHVLPHNASDCDYGFYLHPEGSSWEGLREAWIELAEL